MPRPTLLAAIAGAWAFIFLMSFFAYAITEPLDSGFTKGLNRVGEWLKWQGGAFVVAGISFAIGRNFKVARSDRDYWLAYGPIWISGGVAALLVLGAIVAFLFLA